MQPTAPAVGDRERRKSIKGATETNPKGISHRQPRSSSEELQKLLLKRMLFVMSWETGLPDENRL